MEFSSVQRKKDWVRILSLCNCSVRLWILNHNKKLVCGAKIRKPICSKILERYLKIGLLSNSKSSVLLKTASTPLGATWVEASSTNCNARAYLRSLRFKLPNTRCSMNIRNRFTTIESISWRIPARSPNNQFLLFQWKYFQL